MRYIGSELPAHTLSALSFGHIHENKDNAGRFTPFLYRACDYLTGKFIALNIDLRVFTQKCLLHNAAERLAAVQLQNRTLDFLRCGSIHTKHFQSTGVVAENFRIFIKDNQSLAHVLGNNIEFFPSFAKLFHLTANAVVLLGNTMQQWSELIVAFSDIRMVKVDFVNRTNDCLRHAIRNRRT